MSMNLSPPESRRTVIHSNASPKNAIGIFTQLQLPTPTFGAFESRFKVILVMISTIWDTPMSMKSLFLSKFTFHPSLYQMTNFPNPTMTQSYLLPPVALLEGQRNEESMVKLNKVAKNESSDVHDAHKPGTRAGLVRP